MGQGLQGQTGTGPVLAVAHAAPLHMGLSSLARCAHSDNTRRRHLLTLGWWPFGTMPMELDRDDLWRKAKAYTDMLCAYGKACGRIDASMLCCLTRPHRDMICSKMQKSTGAHTTGRQ